MVNIFLLGRLGADSEVVDWKNGKFIQFRMGVDDWNNGKTTSWFRVTCDFNEKIPEYLKKGKMVQVIGTETVSTYTAKDGSTQISRDVRAKSVELINTGNGGNSEHQNNNVSTGTLKKDEPVVVAANAETTDSKDDLPF